MPVALVKGKVHYHTGRKDAILMKALLEAVEEACGVVSILQITLGIPSGVMAALISSAVRNGYLFLDGERLTLSNDCSRALNEENMDSFLGIHYGTENCEWALDLSSGLVHDFTWMLEHTKRVNGVSDVVLAQEIAIEKITRILKEMRLRDLIHASSINRKFDNKDNRVENEARITCENIDYIDEIECEETLEVAVPIAEHSSGEITRWLVEQDTPFSVVNSLIRKKPDLFKIKYELKEGHEKWVPSEATILLDKIDKLWEKVQNAPLRKTSKSDRTELAFYAFDEVNRWKAFGKTPKKPYSDAKIVDVWSGPAAKQGKELKELMKRVRKKLVILTSFLNRKYVTWVADILSNLPKDAEVLILYGHANPENVAEQNAELQSYKNELLHCLRSDIVLNVGITTKRTHEKIILLDSSNCVLGSWNVCSSNPESDHFEVNVRLRSLAMSTKLCSILKEEVSENETVFIESLEKSLEETEGYSGIDLKQRIDWLSALMGNITVEKEDEISILRWRDWRDQLLGLRDLVWTFFYSPPMSIIETESLRDEFVRQIRSSNHSILIATDRVNYNGLDVSLINHLFEKPRLIRIVWGMEAPEWDFHNDSEVQAELDTAADTLQVVIRHGHGNVLTSLKPMLNHSKLLIMDENRVLISSYNFLAKGNEPTEESSREIGVLIESPLIARKLLGQFMLHSKCVRGLIDLRERVGQPWDLYELIRQAAQDVWVGSGLENPGRSDLVSFAVKSNFLGFTPDGKIVGEEDNQCRPTDYSLSTRWEFCMRFFGKGRFFRTDVVEIPPYEEDLFRYACAMIGIQQTYQNGTCIFRPRSKSTFVPTPIFLEKEMEQNRFDTKNSVSSEDWMDGDVESKNKRLYNLRIGKERNHYSNSDSH
jgi:phosphatidylserine/phosphatidylglycerophosphate/cardiolipin synthase-like enzyme